MPDVRPVNDKDAARITAALQAIEDAQTELERAVAKALKNGASIRSVAALGLAPATVQKYGRAWGLADEAEPRAVLRVPVRPVGPGAPRREVTPTALRR